MSFRDETVFFDLAIKMSAFEMNSEKKILLGTNSLEKSVLFVNLSNWLI